jgi:non-haem Fe2+, alpha-ketoglutarate-dependent halogenase
MQSVERPNHLKTLPLLWRYGLSRLTPLHRLLPEELVEQLPLSWNLKMLSTHLLSRRQRIYGDVYCRLKPQTSYAPKAQVAPELRMSPAELEFFWKNGFSGPHTLCSPEEMSAQAGELWAIGLEPSTIYPQGSYGSMAWVGGTERGIANGNVSSFIINSRDKHLQSPKLLELLTRPAIRERVAQLLGPDLLVWRSQYFPKLPGMAGTGWHQASVYLETMRRATLKPRDLGEMFQVTVWVAVSDATKENGCLRFIPGTHREIMPLKAELYDPLKHKDNKKDHFGTYLLKLEADTSEAKAVDVPMKAGQFVIFSERVIHGALDNRSDQRRLGIAVRYITPQTRVYNRYEFETAGHDIGYLGVFGLPLDRWRAVLVRGRDSGDNGDRVIPLEPKS